MDRVEKSLIVLGLLVVVVFLLLMNSSAAPAVTKPPIAPTAWDPGGGQGSWWLPWGGCGSNGINAGVYWYHPNGGIYRCGYSFSYANCIVSPGYTCWHWVYVGRWY